VACIINMNEIDEFGVLDVTTEDWGNLEIGNYDRIIHGTTLNNLLRSQFIVFSDSRSLKSQIPGGCDMWVENSESVFVTLMSFCSIEHVLRRVFVLVLKALLIKKGRTNEDVLDISIGAIRFLDIWIKHFRSFISDANVVIMKNLLEDFVSYMHQSGTISSTPTSKLELSLLELLQLVQYDCCLENMSSKSKAEVRQRLIVGAWDNTSEVKLKESKEKKKARDLKRKEVSKAREKDKAMPTIAIFGVTQDLLDDESSDEEEPPMLGEEDSEEDEDEQPEPRIPLGFNLLQDPSTVSMWVFDRVEIARQWTLLDHNLFAAIPLDGLHECQWAEPRHTAKARAVRRFIDRFNAVSSWVTESILMEASAERRGDLYDMFVDVAVQLEALNNFNGVMAIVTALQQGCITRMKGTLKYVSDASNKALKRLQVPSCGVFSIPYNI
jgi:hypothetical protein